MVAGLAGTAAETMIRPRIKVGESLTGRVLASGQVLMCELEASGLLAEHLAADQQLGYTHYLGAPLLVGERAIGVLTFRARRPFTAREQELAETFAGQAAIAIDHSRLYREASEQADRMRVVAELGRVLVSTLDESRVLDIVATQAHESLGRLDIAIWLQEADGGPLHMAAGQGPFSGPLAGRAQPLNLDEGVVGRALTERAPVWTGDVLNDPSIQLRPESRRWIEEIGGRSILAVPLIREHLMGALVVYRAAGQVFSSREVEYLSAFANQVAVALENARLYQALDVRAARLRSLAHLAQIVSSSLDMDEVLRAIAEAAGELIAVPLASFWVANEGARTVDFRTASIRWPTTCPPSTSPSARGTPDGWPSIAGRWRSRTSSATPGSPPRNRRRPTDCLASSRFPSCSRTRCWECSPSMGAARSGWAPTTSSSSRASWRRRVWPFATPPSTRRPGGGSRRPAPCSTSPRS